MTVTNSTVSSNDATNAGGGLINTVSILSIRNCTITGNTAPTGGGVFNYAVSSYTGGVYAGMNVKNTIIANQAGDSPDCYLPEGFELNSLGYNIDSDSTCNLTSTGDQPGEDLSSTLGALGNNGGSTYTHALLSGSIAIDAIPDGVNGCDAGTSKDQRGEIRDAVTGEGAETCDVGAYERQTGATAVKPANLRAVAGSGGLPVAGGLVTTIAGLWATVVRRKKHHS
jgi:hypothetical protein